MQQDVGIKYCNDPNAFIECSNTIDDIYENIDDYNPNRKRKILNVFDDMIADIMTNKKISSHSQRTIYQMRKTRYFTCIYHTVLFFCFEICQTKFNSLFDYEN